jgi:hypothetical protein
VCCWQFEGLAYVEGVIRVLTAVALPLKDAVRQRGGNKASSNATELAIQLFRYALWVVGTLREVIEMFAKSVFTVCGTKASLTWSLLAEQHALKWRTLLQPWGAVTSGAVL